MLSGTLQSKGPLKIETQSLHSALETHMALGRCLSVAAYKKQSQVLQTTIHAIQGVDY